MPDAAVTRLVRSVLWCSWAGGTDRVDWSDLSGWVAGNDPVDTVALLAAAAGVVIALYVAAVGVLWTLAGLPGLRVLGGLAQRVTVPPLRRLLNATEASSMVFGSMSSVAHPAPQQHPVVQVRAPLRSPPARCQRAFPYRLRHPCGPTTPAVLDGSRAWTMARRESWWSIAATAAGDGALWRDLQQLNVGREVAPGVVLDAGTVLEPGMRLIVPGQLLPERTNEVGPTWCRLATRSPGSPPGSHHG